MIRPGTPTQLEVMQAWIEKYLAELHTGFPARVQSYDPATQTADLEPLIRYPVLQPDGSYEYEDLPVLPAVPILFPRTAGWFLALPIDVDDTVMVMVSEVAFGHWRAGDGAKQYPGDLRRHHLANVVALPGLFVAQKKLKHAPPKASDDGDTNAAMVLGSDDNEGTRITIQKGGAITITQGSDVRLKIEQGGKVLLGSDSGTQPALMGTDVKAWMDKVKTAINSIEQDLVQISTHVHTGYGYAPSPSLSSIGQEQSIPSPPDLSTKVENA